MDRFLEILYPALVFAALGILMGILLAVAGRVFSVKKDERIEKVAECLPGANCGGCGYAGCAALADAIVKGEAKTSACSVGGPEAAGKIAEIMGLEAEDAVPMLAHVTCAGKCGVSKKKFIYSGAADCAAAERLGRGDKVCPDGCIGLGTCVSHCPFEALSIRDGIAFVDEAKCRGCGVCVTFCPKNVIRLVPKASPVRMRCVSTDGGKAVRSYCEAGCIGCKICEKACEVGAVKVVNNVARIDHCKCVGCGKCAEKCPRKILEVVK